MIKREFKVNLKSFIIWLSILIVMFLFVYMVYPYIITEDTINQMDELMKVFPPEILKAFNMDMDSITTAFGWVKSEGLIFAFLLLGIFAANLGGNILLKEESDKTIEYLGTLPITRSRIITNKIIVSLTYIISTVLIFGIFNYICLTISGDFNHKQFFLLFTSPIFVLLPLFAISLFISTFFHKNKTSIGISLGLVFISYVLNILSELSDKVEFLKYFSLNTLADLRNIISNVEYNYVCAIISLCITVVFIVATYIRYNKKELLD